MTSVYLFCAILGTTIVVISLFVGFLGLGGDGIDGGDVIDAPSDSVDAGAVHDGGAGFLRAFSFKSLSAGIAFFGLAGLAALELEASQGLAAGIATLCGAIAMWGVYRLMKLLVAFNYSGSLVRGSEIGAEGTVYLRIPGGRAGVGKATILQQGRTVEYEAVTDSPDSVAPGVPIVVVKALSGSQLLVEPRK